MVLSMLHCIVYLFLLIKFSACGVHRVPVEKRLSLREKLGREGRLGEYADIRAKRLASTTRLVSHQDGLNDYADSSYVANITLGTPPQVFQIIFDTEIGYTFVPDSTCSDTNSCNAFGCNIPFVCATLCDKPACCGGQHTNDPQEAGCDNVHKYNASASSTYTGNGQEVTIFVDAVIVDMTLAVDTFAFGEAKTNPLVVPGVTFGRTFLMVELGEYDDPTDGLVGLAFPPSTDDNNFSSPFAEAVSQRLVDSPVFTVFLESEGANALNRPGGSFTFGGLDTDNCGDVFEYNPLISDTYFEFAVKSVTIGAYSKSDAKWTGRSLSRASFIAGPEDVIADIAASIGATFDSRYLLYVVDCQADIPDLQLSIGGTAYIVKKRDLVTEYQPNVCTLTLIGNGEPLSGLWELGVPFIRAYCHVYDVGGRRIGFAPKKNNN